MNSQALIFDIETGPESDDVLAELEPAFEAPANYKDPAKIEAKIAEQREAWRSRAALFAESGQVLAIGLRDHEGTRLLMTDRNWSEKLVVREFWQRACPNGKWRHLIGFNSNRFDLPFLARRSFKLGVPIPYGLLHGRYLNPRFVDLMDLWRCGDHQASISLDRLAKHLGCGSKNGEGSRYAEIHYNAPACARAYLENDIELTYQVALRLGLLECESDNRDY